MGISYNTSMVREGLVLHLDAANKKSYSGSGTTWYDLSSNGNNGTLVNGVLYETQNNGVMTFDATNDYVESSLSTTLSINNTYSFEIFMRAPSGGVWHTGIGTGHELLIIGSNGNQVINSSTDNILGLVINGNANNTVSMFNFTNSFTCNYTIQRDAFYHFVGTHTPGTNGTKLYVNGQLHAQANMTSSLGFSYDGVNIGGGYFGVGNKSISLARIYTKTLTLQEIRQNFEATRSRYDI